VLRAVRTEKNTRHADLAQYYRGFLSSRVPPSFAKEGKGETGENGEKRIYKIAKINQFLPSFAKEGGVADDIFVL